MATSIVLIRDSAGAACNKCYHYQSKHKKRPSLKWPGTGNCGQCH